MTSAHVFLLRREAVDRAGERLTSERPNRGRAPVLRLEVARLLRGPGATVADLRAFLARFPDEASVNSALPQPTSRRPAGVEQVAAEMGVSHDVLWGALRGRPLSPRTRRAILACPAFAGMSEAELWTVKPRFAAASGS